MESHTVWPFVSDFLEPCFQGPSSLLLMDKQFSTWGWTTSVCPSSRPSAFGWFPPWTLPKPPGATRTGTRLIPDPARLGSRTSPARAQGPAALDNSAPKLRHQSKGAFWENTPGGHREPRGQHGAEGENGGRFSGNGGRMGRSRPRMPAEVSAGAAG